MEFGMTDTEAVNLARSLPGDPDILGIFTVDRDWKLIRLYEPVDDGHHVELSVMRMPAQAWRITCPDLGLNLFTGAGSGMGELATGIAGAIAAGMLTTSDDSEAP